jgi:glycosyltransferase involved in cell wall biosynthesis
MKLSLAILTLNEITGLRDIFDKIPTHAVDEIIAIDGGSTDGTIEFLEQRQVKTYRQTIPGRGEAFRLAFQIATGDAILFFSPDGNEDPNDIPKFKPFFIQGADIVIGTRMVAGAHNEEDELFFKWRKWANNAFNWMANVTWNRGKFISDSINGYRAITKKAWDMLTPNGAGYTIEYQTTIQAMKRGLHVIEFPTFEANRLDQRSGSPSIRTGLAMLRMYFYELFHA